MGANVVDYFGKVQKFVKVTLAGNIYRLALNTTYPNAVTSQHGVKSINLARPFASGKFVEVTSLDRKVIVMSTPQGNQAKVLEIPNHLPF